MTWTGEAHSPLALDFWHGALGDFRLDGWRIIGAIVVSILTIVVARIVSSRVRHGLGRTSVGPNPTVLVARSARGAVYFLGIIWILAIFSVSFTALAAVVSVTALALSLSLQDLLKSLIAGIYLLAERPFHIGDRITVAGVTGVIDDIQMRATFLHSDYGERIVMPNQTVFTQVIVNNTVSGGRTETLTIEVPRSTSNDEIAHRVSKAVEEMSTASARMNPRLRSVGATADTSKWQLTVWLPEGKDTGDVVLALMGNLPDANIDAGVATAP